MTLFSSLFISSFFVRFARLLGVCLLALTVVAGRAAASDAPVVVAPGSAGTLVEQASPEELSAEDVAVSDDAATENDDRSTDGSEEEDSDEGDPQVEEALQTRDSLWLACSSYELTFHSNDRGMCRCLQVDPGPARV